MGHTPDHDQFLRALGARLSSIRHSRRLSQAQVAEAADVDPQTVQRAETGRTALSLARLRVIAGVLDVGLHDLFSEVDSAVPPPERDPHELLVLSTWARIPRDRRELALTVLRSFAS